jgi:hypothetical protein
VTAELDPLYQVWTKAWPEQDAATVNRLMAPVYVHVAPGGQVREQQTIPGIILSD